MEIDSEKFTKWFIITLLLSVCNLNPPSLFLSLSLSFSFLYIS
jgi:hypothetical protein